MVWPVGALRLDTLYLYYTCILYSIQFMYSVARKAALSNLGYLYCTYSKYASNPMMHTHGMSQVNLTLSDRFISIQCTFLNS